METDYVPPPHINRTLARHVRQGDPFSLSCSVTVDFGVLVDLSWATPNPNAIREGRVLTPRGSVKNLTLSGSNLKVVEQGLTVHRATKDDQGIYHCKVTDHSGNTQTKSEFVRILQEAEAYLRDLLWRVPIPNSYWGIFRSCPMGCSYWGSSRTNSWMVM